MSFNSDTYHANKAARLSAAAMADARAIKARIVAGDRFYDWERPTEKIGMLAREARLHARMSRLFRSCTDRRRRA